MMLNAAVNNWLWAYCYNQKKPVKLTKEIKEYVTSHPVMIDLKEVLSKTFDYSLICLDNPNIVDKRSFLNDGYGVILEKLKTGTMVPRDVMIKTFDANICYARCLISILMIMMVTDAINNCACYGTVTFAMARIQMNSVSE